MLGIFPDGKTPIDAELVREFRKLASCGLVLEGSRKGHRDGWGIVVWKEGLPFYLGRAPTDAFSDEKYEEACKKIEESRLGSPLIAHLRKSSIGKKTNENSHPFAFREWAFAHNGTIRKSNLSGGTDSEWFFHELMKQLGRSGGNIISAIAAQVDAVKQVYRYTSMTFLLSDGFELYAYRDCTRDETYYAMYYCNLGHSVVLAQEKFFDADWNELKNGELLRVDRELWPIVTNIP